MEHKKKWMRCIIDNYAHVILVRMMHGTQYEIDFINGVWVGHNHKNPMHLTPVASQPKPSTSNPRIHTDKVWVTKWCKNNDQKVLDSWITILYNDYQQTYTNKIWFAYHLNYFDCIIYNVLIYICCACLRIEDMTPACPEAVSLQDPGASWALCRPNSSDQNPINLTPARHFQWAVAALQECGPFTRLANIPSIGKIRVSKQLRTLQSRDLCLQRVEKLRKGWRGYSWFLATGLQLSHAIIQPWWFSSTCIASMFAHFRTTKNDTKKEYYTMTWLNITKTMDAANYAMWCYVFSPLDRISCPVSKLLTSDSKTPPKSQLVAPETAPRSNTPSHPALKSLTRWTGNLWNWPRDSRQAIIAIMLVSRHHASKSMPKAMTSTVSTSMCQC